MVSTAFRPSAHGWPFTNSFPGGFCAGMSCLALDRYYSGQFIPDNLELPNLNESLYNEIYQRQVDVIFPIAAKFYEWQAYRSDEDHTIHLYDSIGKLVNEEEWPATKREIDANRPVMLGLVRSRDILPTGLGENHVVLAYRYDYNKSTKVAKIWIYDPNHPNDNSVFLQITLGQEDNKLSARQSTAEPFRGFFTVVYDREATYRKILSTTFNNVNFDKIIAPTVVDRLHQYLVSFNWSGNIYIDYSITRISRVNNQEMPCKIPDDTGLYQYKRCEEQTGFKNVPIWINDKWGTNHTILLYQSDQLIESREVVLMPPYIYALPFLHEVPTRFGNTDPGWSIKDSKMEDIVMMQDNVSEQEISNYSGRIIEINDGPPIFSGVDPSDPDIVLVRFEENYKLGYIIHKIFCRVIKGLLADNNIVTYTIVKRRFGAASGTTIDSGTITEEEMVEFGVIDGFIENDYIQDQTLELTIRANEFGLVRAESKDIIYAKSLLCIRSPFYSKWAISKIWRDIINNIHEYIDKSLIKEIIAGLSPSIQLQLHNHMQETNLILKEAANSTWEQVKVDPSVIKRVKSIYQSVIESAPLSFKCVPFNPKISGKELDKVNKASGKQALAQAVTFLKSYLIKRIIDGGILSKIIKTT